MPALFNPEPLDRFHSQPAVVRRLIDLYLEITPECIEKIQASIGDNDAEQVAFHAHSLKGSSSELGAEQMADLGLQLQMAGRNEDWALIRDLAGRLQACMAETRSALNALDIS